MSFPSAKRTGCRVGINMSSQTKERWMALLVKLWEVSWTTERVWVGETWGDVEDVLPLRVSCYAVSRLGISHVKSSHVMSCRVGVDK